MKNKFLQEMKSRGYIHKCTNINKLAEICNKQSVYGYIGFDCTAKSLHVGSLLQIMILKLMQKYGHKPIILLGGGTTLIGDPSGKDTTRKILSEKQIKTIDKTKSKINPCTKNPDFCAVINKRIEKTRKQLLGLNLQARIEKNHKRFFANQKKD